jgi:hypothetical protein
MKNILIIALLIISSLSLKAQGQFAGGKHYAQPDLARFEGKWRYSDGNTSFTLILRMEKLQIKKGTDDFSLDVIQGMVGFWNILRSNYMCSVADGMLPGDQSSYQ